MIQHLACEMDGNRRWATGQGIHKLLGHRQGVETVKLVAEFCLENKIRYLSLYTLSIENLNRTPQEKDYLFSLITENAPKTMKEFVKKGIQVLFIGDRSLFPSHLVPVLDDAQEQTKDCKNLTINFLFCYGARQEITDGVKKVARALRDGTISEDTLNSMSVDQFKNYLWIGAIPDPEIIIRPGKVVRLSNFMLYQGAYSEWYFPNCLWPELSKEHLREVLEDFAQRKRNFGK